MAEYTTSKPEWAPEQDDNNFACGVMSGIEGITDTTVGNLNPALKDGTMKPKRKMILSVDDYIKGVSAGDRVTLAILITSARLSRFCRGCCRVPARRFALASRGFPARGRVR